MIAWDPHDQWSQLPGWKRFGSLSDLHHSMQTSGKARLAYVVGADDIQKRFDQFCQVALQWGRVFGPCSVIAEELADVSSSGKAPGGWGALLRGALKLNMDIYAISQRWAEADKTALNNASEIVCFAMMPMDQAYMAKRTGIDAAELAALRKSETSSKIACPYVRLAIDSGTIQRDRLQFRRKLK